MAVEIKVKRGSKAPGSVVIGQVKTLNYDIKAQAISAYMVARKTMTQDLSYQVVQNFTLSKFFDVMKVLSNEESIDPANIQDLLRNKLLAFNKVMRMSKTEFELTRKSKLCNHRRKQA